MSSSKPGRKPRRLYLRLVESGGDSTEDAPAPAGLRAFLTELDRVERLVAHGSLTDPVGDLLVFRASEPAEARRVLRRDPWKEPARARYELWEWDPSRLGAGVNLDIPPLRGSGRLTLLQRVAVVVSDQDRAIRFYRDGLGLEVRVRDPDTGYVELSLGKGTAALSLIVPRPEWAEPYYAQAKARIGTPTGIAFQTDSASALALRLKNLGARITQPPRTDPWGSRSLRFADPDGNEFLAFEPAPRKRSGGRG